MVLEECGIYIMYLVVAAAFGVILLKQAEEEVEGLIMYCRT